MKSFTEADAQAIAQQFIDSMEKEPGCEWRFASAERCRIFRRKWNVIYHVHDSEGARLDAAPIVVVNEMDKSASVFPGL